MGRVRGKWRSKNAVADGQFVPEPTAADIPSTTHAAAAAAAATGPAATADDRRSETTGKNDWLKWSYRIPSSISSNNRTPKWKHKGRDNKPSSTLII